MFQSALLVIEVFSFPMSLSYILMPQFLPNSEERARYYLWETLNTTLNTSNFHLESIIFLKDDIHISNENYKIPRHNLSRKWQGTQKETIKPY